MIAQLDLFAMPLRRDGVEVREEFPAYQRPAPPPPPIAKDLPPAPPAKRDWRTTWREGKEIVSVDPKRIGNWQHEGDVRRSMSCQSLAEEGRIRKPFRLRGADWVQTGGLYGPDGDFYECYRVVPVEAFDGPHQSYSERSDEGWEAARNNPLGGYHGVRAKSNGRDVVLLGPSIVIVEGAPDQGALL